MNEPVRYALGLEYDGQSFFGWQKQPDLTTVQGCVEHALGVIAGHPIQTVASGRTDTGVHALAQVIHFDTTSLRPDSAWVRGANANLPDAVRILWVKKVPLTFHARFSAMRRQYKYILYNAPVAPAVMHGKVGWFHLPLSLPIMQQAIQHLLGEHDFSAFRAANCQAQSPIRHMHAVSIHQSGCYIVFEFSANAFLYHQVRNMIGALIYVGKGKLTPDQFKELLVSRERRHAPPTFQPDGLYLSAVEYAPDWNLPCISTCTLPI